MKSPVRFALYLIAAAFLAAFSLALMSTEAQAQAPRKQCIVNWPWQVTSTGERRVQYRHKALHMLGSAAVTAAVAEATDDVRWGVVAGLAVGAYREIYKYRREGMTCEISSITFDLAGVALGAGVAQTWLVVPQPKGVQIAFSSRF